METVHYRMQVNLETKLRSSYEEIWVFSSVRDSAPTGIDYPYYCVWICEWSNIKRASNKVLQRWPLYQIAVSKQMDWKRLVSH